jgi:hypothetical protein
MLPAAIEDSGMASLSSSRSIHGPWPCMAAAGVVGKKIGCPVSLRHVVASRSAEPILPSLPTSSSWVGSCTVPVRNIFFPCLTSKRISFLWSRQTADDGAFPYAMDGDAWNDGRPGRPGLRSRAGQVIDQLERAHTTYVWMQVGKLQKQIVGCCAVHLDRNIQYNVTPLLSAGSPAPAGRQKESRLLFYFQRRRSRRAESVKADEAEIDPRILWLMAHRLT